MRPNYTLAMLRGDLFGGITASVVGLPVALAFGVASGLGPIAGMYGAIAVGFFAAVFGGTRSQISGPNRPHERRHGGHRDRPFRGRLRQGVYRCGAGGGNPDRPGRDQNRAVRRLHALLGHIRLYDRHRHHRHAGAGRSLSWAQRLNRAECWRKSAQSPMPYPTLRFMP